MKIALIIPRNGSPEEKSFYDYKFITDFLWSRKYFSYLLAIPVLVSLTPDEHEIRVFDENVEDIDFGWAADLAGISMHTKFAGRAYEISADFRRRGVKTVLGGIHPSMCTEEALEHGDSVVVGEAEHVWEELLKDAEAGRLKRTYRSDRLADLAAAAVPGRMKLRRERYFADIVQTTKGCPFKCEFCSVYAYDGRRIRHKTVDQVVAEIREIHGSSAGFKKKAIFFADDNIIADRRFARELFSALKPLRLNWSCQGSSNVARDDALLALMKEAGCGAILIGFESVSKKNLGAMGKKINLRSDYSEVIRKIQSHGILVHSSFILGYDFDSPDTFDNLADFIEQNDLLMPLINILTPFPGTRLFERLEREGRILHRDWSRYDTKHVVFRPARMTPEELMDGYRKLIRRVYSFDTLYRKLNVFWDSDFWKHSNEIDPIAFKYRLLFALRLGTLLFSTRWARSRFIFRILPQVFEKRVRISTIVTLMAYNDYAYS